MTTHISWVSKKLVVDKSPVAGKGVFTKSPIKKGEKVATFGGFVIHLDELKQLEQSNAKEFETITNIGYQIDDFLVYSPTQKNQFSVVEYLNHSCDPNCGFDGPIDLIAMRDIKKGEEISMDYAMCVSNKLFEMPCNCGSAKCRKQIKATDWKNALLQKKYRLYFQPYLKRKIATLQSSKT